MLTSYEKLKNWRVNTKRKIVEIFGGKCFICGYSKCGRSLSLHHVIPSNKDFTMGQITARARSWEKIKIELRKCVMLCSNCHMEVHEGITKIPEIPSDYYSNLDSPVRTKDSTFG